METTEENVIGSKFLRTHLIFDESEFLITWRIILRYAIDCYFSKSPFYKLCGLKKQKNDGTFSYSIFSMETDQNQLIYWLVMINVTSIIICQRNWKCIRLYKEIRHDFSWKLTFFTHFCVRAFSRPNLTYFWPFHMLFCELDGLSNVWIVLTVHGISLKWSMAPNKAQKMNMTKNGYFLQTGRHLWFWRRLELWRHWFWRHRYLAPKCCGTRDWARDAL